MVSRFPHTLDPSPPVPTGQRSQVLPGSQVCALESGKIPGGTYCCRADWGQSRGLGARLPFLPVPPAPHLPLLVWCLHLWPLPRSDPGREVRPGDSSVGQGAGLPPRVSHRGMASPGKLRPRGEDRLYCRGHLGVAVRPPDSGSQGQDSTVRVLDCLKSGTGLEGLTGPHAQCLWHPEAPTPVASHFLSPAAVRGWVPKERRVLLSLCPERLAAVCHGAGTTGSGREAQPASLHGARVHAVLREALGSESGTETWLSRQAPGRAPTAGTHALLA